MLCFAGGSLLGCGDSSEDNPSDKDSQGPRPDGGSGGEPDGSGGTNPLEDKLPESTGNATADQLITAALGCGYQSYFTVPAGWQMVPVGEQGCAVWTPAGWIANGAGGPVTSITADASEAVGYLSMAGTPDFIASVECTPAGATDYLLQNVEAGGCGNIQRLYYQGGVESVAGVNIPKADVIFTCQEEGETALGYAWVTVQGTSPMCNLLVLGFWMPVNEIQAQTCTLAQIMASNRCPQPGGGFCTDADCGADCVALGKSGGQCDQEDNCICQ